MKQLILLVLLCAIPAAGKGSPVSIAAKDFSQTEDVINNILKEEPKEKPADAKKAEAGEPSDAGKKEAATPAEEKKVLPDAGQQKEKKGAAAKEQTAPRITTEEQALYKTGVDFYNTGLYDHSLKKFQDLSTKFPQGTYKDSTRFWMGRIYIKQYKYDDAIREFSAVTAESGDYPASLYYTGEGLLMKGNQISAIEYFLRVQAQFPAHELADKALLSAGRLYLSQQKGGQALDSAVKIIKYYKDRDTVDDAYYLMGKVYEKDPKLKDIETARTVYRQFLKKGDSDPRFGKSPLRKRVQEDLQRIDTMYFKMEK